MNQGQEIEREFVNYLCERYAVSPSQVGLEFQQADIALWTSPEAREQGQTPWMIFEIKSRFIEPHARIVLRRTADIALRTGARHLGFVTPEIQLYYSLEPTKDGWRLEAKSEFPRWDGLDDRNLNARFILRGSTLPMNPGFNRARYARASITVTNAQILSNCYELLYAREHWAPESNLEELCKVLLMRAAWARDNGSKLTPEELRHHTEPSGAGTVPESALRTLYRAAARHFPGALDGTDYPRISLGTFEAALSYTRALPSEPENALSDFLDTSFQNIAPDDLYSTSNAIIQFALRWLEPRPGQTVCDPLCGKGGFLYSAARYVSESRAPGDAPLQLLGMDYNQAAVRVARTRFAFREKGTETVVIKDSNPLRDSSPPCDIVFVNPPGFEDVREAYDLELFKRTRRSGVLFLEYALRILKEGGRMGIVLPEDILVSQGSMYREVREFVERRAEIELVCRLPIVTRLGGRFLVFLRKRKPPEPRTEVPLPVAFFPDGQLNAESLSFDTFKSAYNNYRETGRTTRGDNIFLYPLDITGSCVWFSPPSPFDSRYPMKPLFMLVARPKLRKLPAQIYRALSVKNGEIVVKPLLVPLTEAKSARVAEPGHIAIIVMGNANTFGRACVVQDPDTPGIPPEQQIAGCLESRNVQLLEVTASDVEPEYVTMILNLNKFRDLEEGVSNPFLNLSKLLQVPIPVPPKDVRETMIRRVREASRNTANLRAQAANLHAQAEQCLKQVENIQQEAQTEILGLF